MTPNEGLDIPQSNGESWDVFAESTNKAMEAAQKRLELEQIEIDRAFARMSKTPDGAIILKYLGACMEAVEDFEPALGFYNGAAFGFWRTGQRHYLKFIKRAIARGEKA